MKKTHSGSCHCGAVRYEADVDLEAGTSRCNCTFCAKNRAWGAGMKPEDFRLIEGEESLGDYQFGTFALHHHFCRQCGTDLFARGNVEAIGGEFVAIQVATLDDVDQAAFAALTIVYQDGRHDNWGNPPQHRAHL